MEAIISDSSLSDELEVFASVVVHRVVESVIVDHMLSWGIHRGVSGDSVVALTTATNNDLNPHGCEGVHKVDWQVSICCSSSVIGE